MSLQVCSSFFHLDYLQSKEILRMPLEVTSKTLDAVEEFLLDVSRSIGYNLAIEKSFTFTQENDPQSKIYAAFKRSLLPAHETANLQEAIITYSFQAALFTASLIGVSLCFIYELANSISFCYHYYFSEDQTVDESICEVKIPHDFQIGIATCTYQDTGGFKASQWHQWEQKVIQDPMDRSEFSGNLFELYQTAPLEVIERLKKLHVNSYRFSVEWSQLEPIQGEFNDDLLDVYTQFCKLLQEHGITSMITFHHFSEPVWFHENGSFSNQQNQTAFVDFCLKVHSKLKPYARYFCTINEPNIEAFSRYIRGAFSPGLYCNFSQAFDFIIGALSAHNQVYTAIKSIDHQAQIGFTHQYLRLIPSTVFIRPITSTISHVVNDLVFDLLKNQKAHLQIPFIANVRRDLTVESDFIGLQHYVIPIISCTGSIAETQQKKMTLMPFRDHPDSLEEAIITTYECARKPIIVTEFGISTNDQAQKAQFLKKAIQAMIKAKNALPEGVLKGIYNWCFTQNLEWDLGIENQNFGAFALIKENGKRKIADVPGSGMLPFIEFAKNLT
jgi:beta-glucosidase